MLCLEISLIHPLFTQDSPIRVAVANMFGYLNIYHVVCRSSYFCLLHESKVG